MSAYGAWELKTSYQLNFTIGLVVSFLLSSGVFLVACFLNRVRIFSSDTKTYTIRLKLSPPISRPSNPPPAEPARPPSLPVQPPRQSRLMLDSEIQAIDLEWPELRSPADEEQLRSEMGGVDGNGAGFSGFREDTVIDLDKFNLRPVLLFKVDPECPELARKRRIAGTVIVEMLVGTDGFVREVSIKKSTNEIFDDEVLAALKLWVFRPWVESNRSLPFRFTVMVEFVLR